MYVCVCHAVTSTQVEAAIEGGAATVSDVTRACRAGGDCGTCHATIEGMINGRCDRSGPIPAVRLVRTRAA
jgi:bacterioferritin-associated ferredoxin